MRCMKLILQMTNGFSLFYHYREEWVTLMENRASIPILRLTWEMDHNIMIRTIPQMKSYIKEIQLYEAV